MGYGLDDILEPLTLWDEYIDPAFRERRPRFVIDENGKERLTVEGKLLGNPRGIGSLGAVGVRQGAVRLDSQKYAEGKKGGFDHHARIRRHGRRRHRRPGTEAARRRRIGCGHGRDRAVMGDGRKGWS